MADNTATPLTLDQFLAANPKAKAEYDRRFAVVTARAKAETTRAEAETARAEAAIQRAVSAEFIVAEQRAMLDLLLTNNAEYEERMNFMIRELKRVNAKNEAMTTELQALRSELLAKALRLRCVSPRSCSAQVRMQCASR